jgi:hypothetical protein
MKVNQDWEGFKDLVKFRLTYVQKCDYQVTRKPENIHT